MYFMFISFDGQVIRWNLIALTNAMHSIWFFLF